MDIHRSVLLLVACNKLFWYGEAGLMEKLNLEPLNYKICILFLEDAQHIVRGNFSQRALEAISNLY